MNNEGTWQISITHTCSECGHKESIKRKIIGKVSESVPAEIIGNSAAISFIRKNFPELKGFNNADISVAIRYEELIPLGKVKGTGAHRFSQKSLREYATYRIAQIASIANKEDAR